MHDLCSLPECQTTAGCKCNPGLRGARQSASADLASVADVRIGGKIVQGARVDDESLWRFWCDKAREMAEKNADLCKELEEAKAFIADNYGDEEKPRYTTRRMRMEMERAREQALEEAADTVGKMGKIEEFDWAGRPKRREPRRSEFATAIRRLKEIKP